MSDDKKGFFEEMQKLCVKHGIVDFFFLGIELSGTGYSVVDIGEDGFTVSNWQRISHIIGEIERAKFDLIDKNRDEE